MWPPWAQEKQQAVSEMFARSLWWHRSSNVGHCGGTPVRRAGCATWMLPVKMATVWVCLAFPLPLLLGVRTMGGWVWS